VRVLTERRTEALGLTPEEVLEVRRRLGREPNPVEWRILAVMWSEHCAYKHSRPLLKLLPTSGPHVLLGPGSNAGVVQIAPEVAVAMKIESHNHPSAVDPFHGAATGVGGIIRDVLAMGARPVALLDSLWFGPLDDPQARRLLEGVVAGIAHYGNAVGVPTVGGEIHHDPCYTTTPLVNVCCVGLLHPQAVQGAAARGVGNVVLYAGARTGRDGIGGAAFASERLEGEGDRRAVQIGDPFAGKLLIEATLEAYRTGAVVAVQDMGAAGLVCAAAELSGRGGVGMELWLDRVPRREEGMTPEEVLLSESQERMLLVIERGREAEVAAIYRRWGLAAEAIGIVTEDGLLRAYDGRGDPVVALPVRLLVEAPVRRVPERAYEPPPLDADGIPLPDDPAACLAHLLRSWEIRSKGRVFSRYDHMVQIRTVMGPGGDAAVLRIQESPPLGIALSVDGAGRIAFLNPWCGGAWAACEAVLNVACTGARPVALTDCLNLGSPERPDVAWALRQVVLGLAEAARALGVPVIGGNVSLYNESPTGPIFPTPVVASLGVLQDVGRAVPAGFRRDGDLVVLVGAPEASLAGSAYLRWVHGRVAGTPLRPDLALHRRLVEVLVGAAQAGILRSAHDTSDGGLAVALAEACILGGQGARCDLSHLSGRADEVLFGEGPSRVVASIPVEGYEAFCALCWQHRVPLRLLGRVGGMRLRVRLAQGAIDLPVVTLREAYG
jgi:phosphoribosylformylglycinamidine synthase II